jgi:hypothetical protein
MVPRIELREPAEHRNLEAVTGVKLSHPGLAHWGVVVIAASVTGATVGMLLAARSGQAHILPIAS